MQFSVAQLFSRDFSSYLGHRQLQQLLVASQIVKRFWILFDNYFTCYSAIIKIIKGKMRDSTTNIKLVWKTQLRDAILFWLSASTFERLTPGRNWQFFFYHASKWVDNYVVLRRDYWIHVQIKPLNGRPFSNQIDAGPTQTFKYLRFFRKNETSIQTKNKS